MTHYDHYYNQEGAYPVHHIGIIYRVNGFAILANCVPEEKMRWIAIHEIIAHELTPFAKQAWSNKFLESGYGV